MTRRLTFDLQPLVDAGALSQIEHAQVPAGYFSNSDAALRQARIRDGTVVTFIGPMAYPDLAAEIADILLRLENSNWVICMGVYADDLLVSVRTRNQEGGAEQLVEAIVGREGPSGGQRMMAGGQVSLRGRDAEQMALFLCRRVLQHLGISPEGAGEPLI